LSCIPDMSRMVAKTSQF